jgi:DNA topoisomerase I
MNLVIVESPAKAKTIQQYLGSGFVVKSSYGHVRDLPKTKMGIDIAANFTPQYVTIPKARPRLAELKKQAKKAKAIYFATDEDREGEAIAWHLVESLKPDPDKVKRITFDEITKSAISKAMEHPRGIDQHLVAAQQARRILDRLVGYELSPLLWKKVRRGLSAGRVQSVAVRLIDEREEEIKAFKPQEYWTIEALLRKEADAFVARLRAKDHKVIPKHGITTKTHAEQILRDLDGATYTVAAVSSKERRRTPPPPFTTSTLQQTAVRQLGFSSKKTMMIAQQLYEGINLGEAGPTGLITYMRTDSVHLAVEATNKAKQVITQAFGQDYALERPRVFRKKAKGAQEAHEAIRPTDPARLSSAVKPYLSPDQWKLYNLIWERMIASQMADARLQQTAVDIEAGAYTFRASGLTVLFDGFVKALGEKAAFKEALLPPVHEGEELELERLDHHQHFTQPPPRYSEASLVKALEEHGIGRPSTYAPTIDTIQKRAYVEKNADKRFQPTEIGSLVNKLLTDHFPKVVDITFTASMENDLDEIASGKKQWQPVIKSFYDPFHSTIKTKEKELNKSDIMHEETSETCPECSHPLVIKLGRFGKFKACTNFPNCRHTEPIGKEKETQEQHSGEMCPKCGRPLVVKRGRYGPFLGCSGYPECKHIKPIVKDTGVHCPACSKGKIVEKTSRRGKVFYACDQYPDCRQAYWSKPTGQKCPQCQSLLVYGAKKTVKCSNRDCSYQRAAEETTG